jgi:exosortase family protein XrtM
MHTLYFLVPDQWLARIVYHHGIVSPGAMVIDVIAPHEAIRGEGNRLWSARASLEIVRGCDGSGLLFLLSAAIIAYPSTWREKLAGLAGALLLIYLLNQLRIVGLYFVAAYRDGWFVPLHSYFVPMSLVMACVAYFAWWTSAQQGGAGAT